MKDFEAFDEKLNWYKGNLHSHTVNSDGHLTPEQAVRLYRSHDYQFLCFSEHDRYTDYSDRLNTDGFIILPGVEASALLIGEPMGLRCRLHHIHGILGTRQMQENAEERLFENLDKLDIPIYRGSWDGVRAGQQLNDFLRAHGCFTVYNHPIWSRVDIDEVVDIRGLTAIEVFNYNTVNESGTGYDTVFWDMMLRRGCHINATASDDNHNEGLFSDSCGGWIMANASSLEHDSIVEAIMKGQYYSSSGPQIFEWGIKDNVCRLRCSRARRVNFIAGGNINDGRSVIRDRAGEFLTYAEYALNGTETYVRAECTDEYGRTAWTNPIYAEN